MFHIINEFVIQIYGLIHLHHTDFVYRIWWFGGWI